MNLSSELRAQELIKQMTSIANQVDPDVHAMINCIVAAAKLLAELPAHGLSGPRRAAVNNAIKKLTALLEMLAVLVKKHIDNLQKACAGGGAAGVFKPRF